MQSSHSTTSTNSVPLPCQALTTQAPSTDLFDTMESTDFGNTDTICLSPSDFGLYMYDQEPEVVNLFTDLNFSHAPTIFTSAVSTVTSAAQTVAATSTVQTAGPCSLDGYDASLPPPPPELWMESFPDHISYLAIPMPPRLKSSVPLPQPEVSAAARGICPSTTAKDLICFAAARGIRPSTTAKDIKCFTSARVTFSCA